MNENEAYIDNTLRRILDAKNMSLVNIDHELRMIENKNEIRKMNIGSKFLRSLRDFEQGDSISLILTDIEHMKPAKDKEDRDLAGSPVEHIVGTLSNPRQAIMAVRYVDGTLNDWVGQEIGLATSLQYGYGADPEIKTLPHFVAGYQQFAYFSPDDVRYNERGNPVLEQNQIHNLVLCYGKLAVNDAVIFDFMK